jgi:hypothetical protein
MDPHQLGAVGLAPDQMLQGYVQGLFPMDEAGATGPVGWYFTDPRAVDPFTEEPLELETPDRLVRLAVATGVNTRFYLNDRYFVSYELRYELDGHLPRLTHAGGIGVQLGR